MNGWPNRATWMVQIWFDGTLDELRREHGRDLTASDCREYIWELVEDIHPEAFGASFVSDALTGVLESVDWWEIARHLNAGYADDQAA